MDKKQIFSTFKDVYSNVGAYVATFVATGLISILMFKFTNFDSMYYGKGPIYAYSQVILQIILALLTGINVALLWHKLKFSAQFNGKEAGATTIGSVFGVLVSGCPSCGITIASYLGLGSILTQLPFSGTELKIVGLGLLIYSINSLVKNMYLCDTKVKKDKKNKN
jgi:hypothetical protein